MRGIRRVSFPTFASLTVSFPFNPLRTMTPSVLTALAALTLAPRQVILVPADDGPEVTEDIAFLAAHSTVFRDMFSLPSNASDASDPHISPRCEVAETSTELSLMLRTMHGTETAPDFAETLKLCNLADKYESPVLQSRAVAGLWQAVLQWSVADAFCSPVTHRRHNSYDPLSTYSWAVHLRQSDLAKVAADASLSHAYIANSSPDGGPEGFRALPAEARLKLVRRDRNLTSIYTT